MAEAHTRETSGVPPQNTGAGSVSIGVSHEPNLDWCCLLLLLKPYFVLPGKVFSRLDSNDFGGGAEVWIPQKKM